MKATSAVVVLDVVVVVVFVDGGSYWLNKTVEVTGINILMILILLVIKCW